MLDPKPKPSDFNGTVHEKYGAVFMNSGDYNDYIIAERDYYRHALAVAVDEAAVAIDRIQFALNELNKALSTIKGSQS